MEDFKPSTLNQPGQEFPKVNSQGYSRFRVVAPQAQNVSLGLGGRGGTVLSKVEDGTWMGTTAGIKAVSFISENTAHEFQTWRRSLLQLAPLLF